jgi:DNA primase
MIPRDIVDKVLDTANVVEVINEFVQLKKSGSSYKGLSPFVNEKSPSFMVSPSKGIFKDFSSGKGGNVVTFLMEHEHFTFSEAIKWLAKKYNIEYEEKERTAQEIEAQGEKESLFLVNQFAKDFFVNELHNTQEGKAIGLSYFKERGFSEATITKFELGYSPDRNDALTKAALEKGYKLDYLSKTGLTKSGEKGEFDFFRGRVIFPIQNITGRVLGFGGRTLKADKKIAKYFNSPESEIYNKSAILYGLYQSKNAISKQDECFLVEGYTDVISMHQSGLENVVSSSGTSLTDGQIGLIKRYTKNVTILYDGDAAGIKASFRGIDLILAQGLSVKVVLFPDGDDPDSYSKKVSNQELLDYINSHKQDFLHFKADILLKDAANDPIKRADTIKDIVNSISLIPDEITRSVYIQATSQLFEMAEQTLLNEVNKLLKKAIKPSGEFGHRNDDQNLPHEQQELSSYNQFDNKPNDNKGKHSLDWQERDLARIMVQFGSELITVEATDANNSTIEAQYPVSQYIIEELVSDDLKCVNESYQLIFDEFLEGLQQGLVVNERHFINHTNTSLSRLVVDISSQLDSVSENWFNKHGISPRNEGMRIKESVEKAVATYKMRVLENIIIDKQESLKNSLKDSELEEILTTLHHLLTTRNNFAEQLGIVITR